MQEYKSLTTIIEQLELCGFKDVIGHKLSNNSAFIALKDEAEKEDLLPSEKVNLLTIGINNLIEQCSKISITNLSTVRNNIESQARYLKDVLEGKL